MKYTPCKHFLLALATVIASAVGTQFVQGAQSPKMSFKDIAKEAKAQADSTDMRTKLANAQRFDGMFTAWIDSVGKLYLQLPSTAFDTPYLLVNRINSISQTSDYVAGQMCGDPMIIKFSKDPQKVYLHLVQTSNSIDVDDPIYSSYGRNFLDPVLKGFTIEQDDSIGTIIDVTNFFVSNEKSISPIKETNPVSKLLGAKDGIKGTYYSDGSSVVGVKSFP